MAEYQARSIGFSADAEIEGAQGRRRVWESNTDLTQATIWDLSEAVRRRSLWMRLACQDTFLRYRRSLLGPFWVTLSMGVTIATLGLIYGSIFKMEMREYLPFLTVSLLVWGLVFGCLSEGCQTFIEAEGFIRQMNFPLSMFAFRVVARNVIIFAHNAVIYVLVALLFPVEVGWATLAAIPGVLALLANALWAAILLGMLSARFRDLPPIVSSLLQLAFFATPVIWKPDLIEVKFVVELNPFYHFIELVRAPLLGHSPVLLNWLVVGSVTVCGWAATLLFYRRFRSRIAFWV